MSNQNKFKVGDRVRVVYRYCSYFDEITVEYPED